MSNYIANELSAKDIGKNFEKQLAGFQMPDDELNVRDIRVINDDLVVFESRNIPPVALTAILSSFYDEPIIHTYNDEGSIVYDRQIKLYGGKAIGYRQRYNDGFNVDEFPSWTSVPETLCRSWNLSSQYRKPALKNQMIAAKLSSEKNKNLERCEAAKHSENPKER